MKFQAIVRTTLIAAAAFFFTLSLSAQNRPATAGKPKMSREDHQKKEMDEMSTELKLTPEQRAKFEQTNKTYDEKERNAKSANKDEVAKIRKDRVQAHRALLNKEQAARFDQITADKQARHEAHQQKKGEKAHGKGKAKGKKAPKPQNDETPERSEKQRN